MKATEKYNKYSKEVYKYLKQDLTSNKERYIVAILKDCGIIPYRDGNQ